MNDTTLAIALGVFLVGGGLQLIWMSKMYAGADAAITRLRSIDERLARLEKRSERGPS